VEPIIFLAPGAQDSQQAHANDSQNDRKKRNRLLYQGNTIITINSLK